MVKNNAPIYQLKVTLQGIRPPIWRRFQVQSDISLQELHEIIQVLMDWSDYHLYEFEVNGTRYATPESSVTGPGGTAPRSVSSTSLRDAVSKENARLLYTYDFGDCWEHQLLLEKILEPGPDAEYPVCIKGKRAAPLEDSGGVPGYYHLLEVLDDPSHPEHDYLAEWAGFYNPEKFDLANINRPLHALKRRAR